MPPDWTVCALKDCSSRKASKLSAPHRGFSMYVVSSSSCISGCTFRRSGRRALVRFANPLASRSDLPQVSQGTRIDEHCYLVIECFLLLVRDDVNILFAVNLRSTWVSRHQTAALLALSYSVSYDQRFTSPKSNTRNRNRVSHYKS